MKVVLSRKGFDSGSGGGASPILPDGTMISLPIPDEGVGLRYADIKTTSGLSYYELLKQLGYKNLKIDKKISKTLSENSEVHLDPDLVQDILPRSVAWKACLGQSNESAGHLKNNHVEKGSVFLFFGRYGKTEQANEEYRFIKKQKDKHIIWGYMHVNEVIYLYDESKKNINEEWLSRNKWINRHPHVIDRNRKANTLYVASERLELPSGKVLPGFGIFKYHPSLQLTEENQPYLCSWNLPVCLHPSNKTTMTYHTKLERWELLDKNCVRLKAFPRWQESVIDGPDVMNWAFNLIEENVCREFVEV